MFIRRLCVLMFSLLCLNAVAEPEPRISDTMSFLDQIKELPKLRKVTHSWSLDSYKGTCPPLYKEAGITECPNLFDGTDETNAELEEYVRITGACDLSLHWSPDEHWHKCAELCAKYNAELGVNYSPWSEQKAQGSSPIQMSLPIVGRPSYVIETDRVFTKLSHIQAIAQEHGTTVSAVMYDHEVLIINTATEKNVIQMLNVLYELAHAAAPDCKVYWYNQGGQEKVGTGNGWTTFHYTPIEVKNDGVWSCSAYYPALGTTTNKTVIDKSVVFANIHEKEMAVFVSLGWSWNYDKNGGRTNGDYTYCTWPSKWIGASLNWPWYFSTPELRERYLPVTADVVFLWPEITRTPTGKEHFIAYVKGASRTK